VIVIDRNNAFVHYQVPNEDGVINKVFVIRKINGEWPVNLADLKELLTFTEKVGSDKLKEK
jgi:hypothetical protein